MQLTMLDLAERFLGLDEIPGERDAPGIAFMHQVVKNDMRGGTGLAGVGRIDSDDETPWCSIAVGFLAYLFNLPRPARHPDPEIRKLTMRARSWLAMDDQPVELHELRPGWDVVVLNRANGVADPTTINAAGHVGLFLRLDGSHIWIRGGNQGNAWSDRPYKVADVLGGRRLWSGP